MNPLRPRPYDRRSDTLKYLSRFGLVLAIVAPILLFTHGVEKIRIMTYKVCLVTLAVGLAELIWAIFFKPVFGRSEWLLPDEKRSILLFRGILYGAVILALTLGL
ncbi:MAG: hypothetical protein M0P74_00850 [Syntrophales bacterium]|jgi:hypothetical protein|nr:hypothetical protein [Syntrophales bacterium]